MTDDPKKIEEPVASNATLNTSTKQKIANSNLKPAPKRKKRSKRGGRKPVRKFPSVTLEQALSIPKAIKQFNAGKPWPPGEVAKALEMKPKTTKFWYLSSGARDYGITIGTRDTAEIDITPLGKAVVYANNPNEEAAAIRSALLNVAVFKAVFDHYQGGALPEIKYLSNTLETRFGLPTECHKEFEQFYTANCGFLNKFQTQGNINTTLPVGLVADNKDGGPIIVGEPSAKTTLRAFVIMPFSEKFDRLPKRFFNEVLTNLITPAGVEAGFKVETARREGSDIIQSTIVNELLEADLVIADLTDHNPNVLFELGLRIAFEKPIALIKAEGTAPIFDVDAMMRVLSYSPNLWKSTLDADIPKMTAHIKGAWERKNDSQTWLKLLKKQ